MKDERPILGINRRNLEFVFDDPTPRRFRTLDDKVLGKERLEAAGVRVPRTLAVIGDPKGLGRLHEVLDAVDELVVKPARGSGGKGILVLARDGDSDQWLTPGGRRLRASQVEDHVCDAMSGTFSLDENPDRVILEERIHPHDFLRDLYPRGLSDLRVVLEDGDPIQAMLRVPTDASDGRANLHGGGLGLGIDLETGTTRHAVQGRREVTRHPDTDTTLLGRTVPDWDECLAVARAAAQAFSEIRYLGVDLVLDARRGPVVLELNARPGLAIQIANRQGQPVRRRTVITPFERFTERAAWLVLLGMLVLPIGFGFWQETVDTEVRSVRVDREVETDETVTATAGVEWSDDAVPVSETDDRFARARTAAAAGDTAQALALYRETTQDDALAPFALNNIALIHREHGDLERALEVLDGALARFPDYARGVYNRGLVLRDLGRIADARAAFVRATELRPGYASAWSELGELAMDSGDPETALDALSRAVRYDPGAVADRWRLGHALLDLDRPGEAAERFREALALGGGTATTRDWIVARFVHADRTDARLTTASYDSFASALGPIALRPRVSRSIAVLWGELEWRRGNRTAAVQWFDRPEFGTDSFAALVFAVGMDLERGAWRRALDRMDESDAPAFARWRDVARLGLALERGDDLRGLALEDHAVLEAAQARIVTGRIDVGVEGTTADAVESRWLDDASIDGATSTPARLRRALRSRRLPVPVPVLAWWNHVAGFDDRIESTISLDDFVPRVRERFETAAAAGDDETAHALGMALFFNDTATTETLVRLAQVELRRERPAMARSVLESVPETERSRPDVLALEADLLHRESRSRDARAILERLVEDDPLNAELLAALARVQSVTGKRRSATANWDRALQQRPDRADWAAERADLLTDRRRYAEAVDAWDHAIDLGLEGDALVSAFFNRALALQRQDQHAAAVADWDSVLAREPDRRAAVFNRALALQELGRDDEAIAAYRHVLAIDPTHEASRQRLDDLLRKDPE